ncbi:MAG: ACP S-malonyltransferase [Deltaproteobacteria bacterium]|nr:ACP S-malonyltransferase [Deltaproteobacteria bacterium]
MLFVFPGQGSQSVGMGRDLYNNFKLAQTTFEEASDTLSLNFKKLCFEESQEELKKTANTQPALLTVSISFLRVLNSESHLKPKIVAGHSLGEYSALVCNGALSFHDALRLVRKRGEAMQEAVPEGVGGMVAVLGLSASEIQKMCEETSRKNYIVSAANFNEPSQTVLSGHKEAVEEVGRKAQERGAKRVIPLKVSAPFHCSLMESVACTMEEALENTPISKFEIPYIANFDGKLHQNYEEVKELLVKQICHSVRWVECMEEALKQGETEGFEIGSGSVLTGLMRKIQKDFSMKSIYDVKSLKEIL